MDSVESEALEEISTEIAEEQEEIQPAEVPTEEAEEMAAANADQVAEEEESPAEQEESEEVVLEEEEIDDGRAWYFIHTYAGYEQKVEKYLEQRIETMGMGDKIFRVIVPTEEEVEIRDGERRIKRRRLFPGYVMVQMIMDEESWYVVRNTPSVTGFVGTESEAMPVRQEEVDRILERMEEEEPRIKVDFRVGETVRITEGPFSDFMAVVEEIYPERGKVRLLVSFFGRETPVEMDFMQVEKV
ncbi:MAG: transcription termination/antitermination protein NusG [Chloroflexota bacterium]|nr:transcription termination/antitermination protein NusG [Chloroflexota bacterium]